MKRRLAKFLALVVCTLSFISTTYAAGRAVPFLHRMVRLAPVAAATAAGLAKARCDVAWGHPQEHDEGIRRSGLRVYEPVRPPITVAPVKLEESVVEKCVPLHPAAGSKGPDISKHEQVGGRFFAIINGDGWADSFVFETQTDVDALVIVAEKTGGKRITWYCLQP